MKSIFRSKTFWVNVLSLVPYGLHQVGISDVPTVPPVVLALLNIALRFVTKQPVSLMG